MANYWLEPEIDGTDKTGDLRSSHLNSERVKNIIVEFIKQFTADEWQRLPMFISKVYYHSQVKGLPLNNPDPYYPELWGYEVKARLDFGKDQPCLVIMVERFFRSRFYGISYREIWIPLEIVAKLVQGVLGCVVDMTSWLVYCTTTYTKKDEHSKSFVCTLRNMNTATTAFKKGLNEKAEMVNVTDKSTDEAV